MFDVIAWATDGSDSADRALPVVTGLAKAVGAKVVVVYVEEITVGRGGGYPVHLDEGELKAKISDQVAQLEKEGIDASLESGSAAYGNAAHVIADAAAEAGAEVIVVGTRGHAPVAGLLLGSVTQRLLHIAPCPVLAVPPDQGRT